MHLKGIWWEMDWFFPIWKTVMTGRKIKMRKTNRPPSILWMDFLRGESFWSLSYQVLWQPDSQVSLCRGAEPQAGWGMTALWRPNHWAGWDSWLWRIGSLGRLRHVDLLGSLDWHIPNQVEAWQPSEDQIPRQVNLLGPLDWSWGSQRSLAWPVLGRVKRL